MKDEDLVPPSMGEPDAHGVHAAAFGAEPDAHVFSPGRVNLIGEHTDYNGGAVLPTALPLGVRVTLTARGDDHVRIASDRFADVQERSLRERASGSWSDYVLGAVARAQAAGLLSHGADVALASDLPDGAGLSSSAAVTVGVLRAAAMAAGEPLDPVRAARMAQAVENDFVGVPCGIMDQMAIALAAPGEALALDTKTLAHETVALPGAFRFAVLHSGVRRALNEGRYAERRAECEAAARALGVEHLCLLDEDALEEARGLAEPLGRRARHCAREHRRTLDAAAALHESDMRTFGALMNDSHASMRDDFEVSLPPIDALVATCQAEGALGARLTGGGFGGCIVALLPRSEAEDVLGAILKRHAAAKLIV